MKTPVYLALKAMVDMMDSGDESCKGSEWYNNAVTALKQEEAQTVEPRLLDAAKRLVDHADFKLGGILSADSKAVSQVKARHLAALRDAIAAAPQPPQADLKERGEVVVTWSQDGQIQAVTRQDSEGRILSIIAESRV